MFRNSMVTKLMALYAIATLTLLAVLGLVFYPTFHELLSSAYTEQNLSHVTLECYRLIIQTFLFAGVSALVMGHWIARKGLKKIQELQKKMETISIEALDQRLELKEWPNELIPLGSCFNQMLDRLETSFRRLTQFSSDIAHELRHPIHHLKQMTEFQLLHPQKDTSLDSVFIDYMNLLDHLNSLIEQLLFLARSENSQLGVQKEKVPVKPIVHQLFELFSAFAEEQEVSLLCEGDAELSVDVTLFQRLLSNLLSNAIHYSSAKGTITVRIVPLIQKQMVQITVEDEGVGIDSIHLSKLCDRFYRVDPVRGHQQGLGLGLSIVKAIMDLHQAHITFFSTPLVGTKVVLAFPEV